MDSQLDAVRHRICKTEDEIVEVKQKVAAAEDAHNAEREQSHFNLLLSLNQQLSGLQEKENILLRSQAPSKSLSGLKAENRLIYLCTTLHSAEQSTCPLLSALSMVGH